MPKDKKKKSKAAEELSGWEKFRSAAATALGDPGTYMTPVKKKPTPYNPSDKRAFGK